MRRSAPGGIRTRATALKGLRPRPLVDGGGLRRIALGLELLLQPLEVGTQLLLGLPGQHRLGQLHERAGLRFRDQVDERRVAIGNELVVDGKRNRAAERLQRQPPRRVVGGHLELVLHLTAHDSPALRDQRSLGERAVAARPEPPPPRRAARRSPPRAPPPATRATAPDRPAGRTPLPPAARPPT